MELRNSVVHLPDEKFKKRYVLVDGLFAKFVTRDVKHIISKGTSLRQSQTIITSRISPSNGFLKIMSTMKSIIKSCDQI